MVTYPKRLVFAGIFVVALAVTSYLPRLVQNARHNDQSVSDGYDSSGFVGGAPDGSRTSAVKQPPKHSDASPAQILQAVRDSLRRNDLESAEVLLGAARALDINNEQAIALQHDLDARMTQKQTASPAAPGTEVITIPRPETRSIPRSARTINSTGQAREPTKRVPLHEREANDMRADLAAARNTPAETAAPIAEVIEKPIPSEGVAPAVHAAPEVVPAPELPPAAAPAPVIASLPVVQPTVRPEPAPVGPSQGPKTREQVRAELERARADGSLSRFGNPDPAGPGVETISKVPPVQESR
ncbi:DUF4148 domain-containing protein [Caballeronia sp.]|uniref:DUF4148 domain-containing protein n=1 Tax=Caballeronia sp. TaxID=1931223 RepID=UPI003C447D7E